MMHRQRCWKECVSDGLHIVCNFEAKLERYGGDMQDLTRSLVMTPPFSLILSPIFCVSN